MKDIMLLVILWKKVYILLSITFVIDLAAEVQSVQQKNYIFWNLENDSNCSLEIHCALVAINF